MAQASVRPAIPLAMPDIREDDRRAVSEVLHSGHLALGPWAERFEAKLAKASGVEHAVVVSSGTSALHLVVRALGIGDGDEVITTPFSFVASANCLLFERATPVFVDVHPDSLCLDPECVAAAITPRTKAILAVDVFGRPANWPALATIAKEQGLVLIEDAAEALGSEYEGRRCGSFGAAAIYGFYPNKQITTGEGGAVVTDDATLAKLCRSLANQGRDEDERWLRHSRVGFNYRMDEMSAALGASQMDRLPEIVGRRREIASWYADDFAGCDELRLPHEPPGASVSWFVYVVGVTLPGGRAVRDAVLAGLRREGIGCRDYFAPIHLQRPYRERFGYRQGQFPICEEASERTLALPFFHQLDREDVVRVTGIVRRLLREAA